MPNLTDIYIDNIKRITKRQLYSVIINQAKSCFIDFLGCS